MNAMTQRKTGCFIGVFIVLSIMAAVFFALSSESEKADGVFENSIRRELAIISSNTGVPCELISFCAGDGNDSWCEVDFVTGLSPSNDISISYKAFRADLEGGKTYRIQGRASFVRRNGADDWKMSWIHLLRCR